MSRDRRGPRGFGRPRLSARSASRGFLAAAEKLKEHLARPRDELERCLAVAVLEVLPAGMVEIERDRSLGDRMAVSHIVEHRRCGNAFEVHLIRTTFSKCQSLCIGWPTRAAGCA